MKRLLYVTNRASRGGIGGREQLSKLHGQILLEIFGEGFDRIELDGVVGISKLWGYLDGVSRSRIDLVCNRILASGAEQVFLDGSNLGRLAQGIRKSLPDVEVLTFFHNCEARFFLGALRRSRSPKALAVLCANYFAERSAVCFSNKRICLSARDSDLLERLYGRGATHISAMALQDRLSIQAAGSSASPTLKYALFVGGAFYANQAGIAWYCKNVAARIPLKTYVVGKGLDALKDELERHGNVKVVGEVDDLAPWYRDAHIVVAPIFDGSGMKTKVAEALMFGKRILGTPEAFSGYEDIAAQAGEVCATAGEFVAAIERAADRPFVAIDPPLRAIYEARYSFGAASSRLCNILGAGVQDQDR